MITCEVYRIVRRQFLVHQLARIAEIDRSISAVVFGELLFDNVCLNRYAEMIRLPREVGRDMIIFLFRFEGIVARVAPQDGPHAQLMRMLKCLAHFPQLPAGFSRAEIDRCADGNCAHPVRLLHAGKEGLVVRVWV